MYTKVVLVHVMKAHRVSGGTARRIRNVDSRWRWVVSFMPQPLDPGKTQVPIEWKAGWSPE